MLNELLARYGRECVEARTTMHSVYMVDDSMSVSYNGHNIIVFQPADAPPPKIKGIVGTKVCESSARVAWSFLYDFRTHVDRLCQGGSPRHTA